LHIHRHRRNCRGDPRLAFFFPDVEWPGHLARRRAEPAIGRVAVPAIVLVNSNLLKQFNLIWVVQSRSRKYFASRFGRNSFIASIIPPRQEGVSRSSRNVERDVMDADVPLTNGTDADGEAVWSWRPDAGVKFFQE
jgi:hypothetical protein